MNSDTLLDVYFWKARYHAKIMKFVVSALGFLTTLWYSALLIASQAVSVLDPTVSNLEDLTETTHGVCVNPGTFSHDLFRHDPFNVSICKPYGSWTKFKNWCRPS